MTYKEAIKELECEYNHLAEEYEFTETCRETQAFKMAIDSLKKQIPAEPIFDKVGAYFYAHCPECNQPVFMFYQYCPYCGRKLKWYDE